MRRGAAAGVPFSSLDSTRGRWWRGWNEIHQRLSGPRTDSMTTEVSAAARSRFLFAKASGRGRQAGEQQEALAEGLLRRNPDLLQIVQLFAQIVHGTQL